MRSVLAQFIKNELDSYATTQRLYGDSIIPFIVKAFEAYDEYKSLVSPLDTPEFCVNCTCQACRAYYKKTLKANGKDL